MERIISARDYARREGARNVKERIARLSAQMAARHLLDTPFVGGEPVGVPVLAEVNHGQWIARCECGGAEAVDPAEPIFYCFNCGNRKVKGKPRAVTFPDNIEEIERILLERPLEDGGGANEIDRVFMARPLVGVVDGMPVVMHRSWTPGESVEELRRQNEMIEKIREQRIESGENAEGGLDTPSATRPADKEGE